MSKFVDKEIRVFEGEEAEKRLKEKNDSKFHEQRGIVQVSFDRWKEAQEYEHKTWMVQGLGATSDHNDENLHHLDNCKLIETRLFKNGIELGCGPFTNMETLSRHLIIRNKTVLDPLLDKYLTHPNHRLASDWTKINSTIEEFEPKEKYDLVVMINVLEHCFDIPKIFQKILDITKMGGIFVFGDISFPYSSLAQMVVKTYNAGHPIRIDTHYLLNFVSQFKMLYRKSFQVKCAGYEAYENYFILDRV